MSFLDKVKLAAAVVVEKTKQGVEHLQDVPTEIKCKGCSQSVMVPPSTFQWSCPRCAISNQKNADTCVGCHTAQPQRSHPYTIECTMCHVVNEVPTSNAKKMLLNAADATKKAAIATKEAAQREYEHLKSRPEKFNCKNCQTLLHNPNYHLPAENKDESAEIHTVLCPVCQKPTEVPTTNFSNSVNSNMAKLQHGAAQAFYSVSGKKYANCPICHNPVKAPEAKAASEPVNAAPHPDATQQPPPSYNNNASFNPADVGNAAAAAATSAMATRVDLQCEKCNTRFPAMLQ